MKCFFVFVLFVKREREMHNVHVCMCEIKGNQMHLARFGGCFGNKRYVCVCCDVQNDVVMHFHSLFFLSGPSCCPMVVICNMGLLLVMIIAIR